jgi:predicted SAM-dependent methyltransferase
MTKLYVQYGSGFCAPEGWLNFDASPTLRFERLPIIGRLVTKNANRFPAGCRYGDIVKSLPIPAGTADAVYASHVLEHLTRQDFHIALRNTFALLKPGGVFRLIVPDLQWRAAEYLSRVRSGDQDANSVFLSSCFLGQEAKPRNFWRAAILLFGNSRHLWMWDEPSIRRALTEAGFAQIRRASFGDSPDPMFKLVETENRFEDHGHAELAMEVIKPK